MISQNNETRPNISCLFPWMFFLDINWMKINWFLSILVDYSPLACAMQIANLNGVLPTISRPFIRSTKEAEKHKIVGHIYWIGRNVQIYWQSSKKVIYWWIFKNTFFFPVNFFVVVSFPKNLNLCLNSYIDSLWKVLLALIVLLSYLD